MQLVGEGSTEITEQIEVLKVPITTLDDFLLNLPSNTELDLRVPGILWVLERKKLI